MTPAASATVVVELTPPGRAAVAVILVAGPEALRAVGNCFAPRNGRPVGEIPSGRIVLGRWGGPDGEELILCRRDEAQIEIHCHGGAAAVQAVTNGLAKNGCQPITWQDWVGRCSPDPIRIAAQISLADAVTERTAAILLDQLNGALAAAVRGMITEISAARWSAAGEMLDELLSRREFGLHLTKPWRVVVFGAPNVGKSSLINALAGYERAIVSTTPGTTRDVVTVTTAIDGWPVQLADTAGFRTTRDELESAGIELATATASEADLVILVHDATKLNDELFRTDFKTGATCHPERSEGSRVLGGQILRFAQNDTNFVIKGFETGSSDEANDAHSTLAPPARTIHVINKVDLISVAERSDLRIHSANARSEIGRPQFVSALTGEGIVSLVASISRSLAPVSWRAGSAVPFASDQFDRLAAARAAVERRDAPAATDLLQALLTV